MNTIRKKITAVIAVVLVGVLGLMMTSTLISSNQHFVMPMMSAVNQNMNIAVEYKTMPVEDGKIREQMLRRDIIEQSERQFTITQIAVMCFLVFAGILISYLWLGRVLEPLNALNQAALKIDANNLDAKIPVSSSKDEVATLSNSFQSMLMRLRTAFEQQEAFAQNAAHELKTPLSIMKSSIQILSLGKAPSIQDYQECTQAIEQSVDDLIEIVNQLLQLTNTDEFEIKPTDVQGIIDSCVCECQYECEKKQIQIFCQCESFLLQTNPVLLSSIIRNLLSNAIKYNRMNGTVWIHTAIHEQTAEIQIRDTGIGISPENLSCVFQPFYREDTSRSKEVAGNGLGLSIVKAAIERLHGEITVESEPKVGTTFKITLPL